MNNISIIESLPIFRSLSRHDLENIAAITTGDSFGPGEYVCRQGETGDMLFVIVTGSVLIREGSQVIARLGPGQVVGELAVLDKHPRAADVVAAERLHLLALDGARFRGLIQDGGALAINLLEELAGRIRSTSARQERVDQLVRAFRERGHVLASLDPLGRDGTAEHPELTLAHYGLADGDFAERFTVMLGREVCERSLRSIMDRLRKAYCGAVGAQYMHIDDLTVQHWLRERLEDPTYQHEFGIDPQQRILMKLTDAEIFETFVHRKFRGSKRFSLQGGETLIPLLDQAIESAGAMGIDEIVIGMAHRGRLNVLANILGKPPREIFKEFEDTEIDRHYGMGDVKYHKGFASDYITTRGHSVHLSLCFNPSHLECVGPVVLGRARADQDRWGDSDGSRVLPLVIHGDAAFAGQGVVQELLNLSALPGYSTGGALHIILNNQLGFTTLPIEGRSSQYATDVARMLQIPIFHVNGERPEAVDRVIQLAMDFRKAFHRDVIVDMYCYRRHGHNEQDEPRFTQPLLYELIDGREPLRENYARNLIRLGDLSEERAEAIATESLQRLERELSGGPDAGVVEKIGSLGVWSRYHGGPEPIDETTTGVERERLVQFLQAMTELPSGFETHPRVQRQLDARRSMAEGGRGVDWGAAEALAIASLLAEGYPVRISGQDSQRGTFAHRHAVIHEMRTGATHVPLSQFATGDACLQVLNSPLSEIAVLGFDFGYSLNRPDALVVWEAQFGDFANMAQVIIDQFITSSEEKWNRLSGITLLLPHGLEGQGPEHSHARPERFLQLAVNDNIQVAAPSTAAQFFHCLRRQVLRPWRKPLIVLTPKGQLQQPCVRSPLDDLSDGYFNCVLGDKQGNSEQASRLLLCSGGIYHELCAERMKRGRHDVHIARLEQLYPLRRELLNDLVAGYAPSVPLIWVQEEPENMGPLPHLRNALFRVAGERVFEIVARKPSASPATGSMATHKVEQESLSDKAFA